jgi:MarR family transcriptional regulator, 2-MHQ and catechol-resistance regulon repressor
MAHRQDRALKLFVVLNRAVATVTAHADADVARHGLSLAEFAALEALYHKGPLLVGELQRAVLKSSGGITYVVDRLHEKGLVRRRPCAEDRRALYAELTPDGTALMERIFPAHAAVLQAAMGGLSARDQEQAIALLKKLGRHAAALPRAAAATPSPSKQRSAREAGSGRA